MLNALLLSPRGLQDRCRELETELAELNLEMDELTSALAQVEADAAASAEEKARLRSEYEARLRDVAAQMSSLQRQLKGQVSARWHCCWLVVRGC